MTDGDRSDCCGAEVMGYEISSVYDGVLYWSCEKCSKAWPRKFGYSIRDQLSEMYADKHNTGIRGLR